MGFRSNFITECSPGIEVPEWFVEKYPKHYIERREDGKAAFPIIQPWESKFYSELVETEIFQDIQRVLKERDSTWDTDIVLILLHECGGITRVRITKDAITGREPAGWKDVESVEHDYCYGCSEV